MAPLWRYKRPFPAKRNFEQKLLTEKCQGCPGATKSRRISDGRSVSLPTLGCMKRPPAAGIREAVPCRQLVFAVGFSPVLLAGAKSQTPLLKVDQTKVKAINKRKVASKKSSNNGRNNPRTTRKARSKLKGMTYKIALRQTTRSNLFRFSQDFCTRFLLPKTLLYNLMFFICVTTTSLYFWGFVTNLEPLVLVVFWLSFGYTFCGSELHPLPFLRFKFHGFFSNKTLLHLSLLGMVNTNSGLHLVLTRAKAKIIPVVLDLKNPSEILICSNRHRALQGSYHCKQSPKEMLNNHIHLDVNTTVANLL